MNERREFCLSRVRFDACNILVLKVKQMSVVSDYSEIGIINLFNNHCRNRTKWPTRLPINH